MADLDPDLAALRDAGASRGVPPMVAISPAEARERVRAGHRLCSDGPRDVPVTDLPAGHQDLAVPARLYDAPGAQSTLVYAHGGGWVTGDLDYSDELCRFLAAAGVRVLSVAYRLAPEHRFPAAHEDMVAAAQWGASSFGAVGLGGDSAGANLAASAALELRDDPAVTLAYQVLVYPVVDTDQQRASYLDNARAFPIGAADMAWFLDHYVDLADRGDPRVAPLQADSLAGLPPTHVVSVGHDPLRDEGVAYAETLAAAGVEATLDRLPTMCHGFLRFTAASARARSARDVLVSRVVQLAGSARAPNPDSATS